jgi:hypothetical protein
MGVVWCSDDCRGCDPVVVTTIAGNGVAVNLYSQGTVIESHPPFLGSIGKPWK